jgi:hypothetical protein
MKYINFNPVSCLRLKYEASEVYNSLCVNGTAFSADWERTEHTSSENVRSQLEKVTHCKTLHHSIIALLIGITT